MGARGWPVTLLEGRVGARPLRLRDAATWSEARIANEAWLAPWEGRQPGLPDLTWPERHSTAVFTTMLRALRREAKEGRCLPFGVTYDGDLVGQITVANIIR